MTGTNLGLTKWHHRRLPEALQIYRHFRSKMVHRQPHPLQLLGESLGDVQKHGGRMTFQEGGCQLAVVVWVAERVGDGHHNAPEVAASRAKCNRADAGHVEVAVFRVDEARVGVRGVTVLGKVRREVALYQLQVLLV